nr:Chain P, Peptide (P9) of Mtb85B (Mycobacterium tuberculosis) YQSGLSIVM [Mycobacterium tuberculosis H37Rv]5TRZ_Q Chain Q, Peptide (P9) of Mtb85B (Mycobacterium tuberculosis) YQSGLSIVM [Mycobacterium tuberculosis H37Rv]
YQSGLSIVM